MEARKQLAAAPEEPPDEPAKPPKKPFLARFFGLASRPVWALVGALVTVFLLIGPGVSLLRTGAQPGPSASPSTKRTAAVLPDGPVQLYLPHSKLCVAEDPTNFSGTDFQTTCAKAFPPVLLEKQSAGSYHLATQHPKLGPGCIGVAGGDASPGAAVANGFCSGGDAVEYNIEPVTAPLAGYRLRPVHSGLCLGIPDNSTKDRALLKQLGCDPAAPGQVFTFEKKTT